MSNNPREEILVAPEFGTLIFGDGYVALLQGGTVTEDDSGRKKVELMIKPSTLMRKRFEIKDTHLDVNGNIIFNGYYDDFIPINLFDDANRKWLYIKNYRHEETELSKQDRTLRKRLESSDLYITVLEGELIWMSEMLHLAKTNPTEFLNKSFEAFAPMLDKILSIRPGGTIQPNG